MKHDPTTFRIGPFVNIPELLRSLGVQPEPILAHSGLSMAELDDPDNKIPYRQGSILLSNCVKESQCQHFGFLLGQHASPSHLGIVGFLMRNSPDVISALKSLVNFLSLHDQGGIVTTDAIDDSIVFSYIITEPHVEAAEQIYDLSMVMACKIMRALCGENWSPEEVLLTRKKPKDVTLYHLFFQAPIRFNSDKNALIFKQEWLNHSLPSADPMLQRYLLKEAEKLHYEQNRQLLNLTRSWLEKNLGGAKCTAAELSKQLGIHERTLHRHLKNFDTNFRRELELIRFEIGKRLLAETNDLIVTIAASLGYANTGTFNRAFRKWSDKTPTQWRKDRLK